MKNQDFNKIDQFFAAKRILTLSSCVSNDFRHVDVAVEPQTLPYFDYFSEKYYNFTPNLTHF